MARQIQETVSQAPLTHEGKSFIRCCQATEKARFHSPTLSLCSSGRVVPSWAHVRPTREFAPWVDQVASDGCLDQVASDSCPEYKSTPELRSDFKRLPWRVQGSSRQFVIRLTKWTDPSVRVLSHGWFSGSRRGSTSRREVGGEVFGSETGPDISSITESLTARVIDFDVPFTHSLWESFRGKLMLQYSDKSEKIKELKHGAIHLSASKQCGSLLEQAKHLLLLLHNHKATAYRRITKFP